MYSLADNGLTCYMAATWSAGPETRQRPGTSQPLLGSAGSPRPTQCPPGTKPRYRTPPCHRGLHVATPQPPAHLALTNCA
jgi:hypothetical protein